MFPFTTQQKLISPPLPPPGKNGFQQTRRNVQSGQRHLTFQLVSADPVIFTRRRK